jgi:hypothetical protein
MAFVALRITSLMAVLLLKTLNSIIVENSLSFSPFPNG